jgi:hypothetical protein
MNETFKSLLQISGKTAILGNTKRGALNWCSHRKTLYGVVGMITFLVDANIPLGIGGMAYESCLQRLRVKFLNSIEVSIHWTLIG